MKIVQVVHAFPPEIGGVEAHVFNLSKGLAKKGHEVTVVTTRVSGKNSPSPEALCGVRVIRQWALPLPIFSSVRFVPLLLPKLLSLDADIYHSHGYGPTQPFVTSITAFIKRKKFVFTLHGYPKLKGMGGAFVWFYRNFPARVFLKIASRVITVTDATVPEIEMQIPRSRITTIPNGVDFERFKAKSKLASQKGVKIAYVGRLDPYKGIDTLVRAFAIIKKELPDARLLVVGKDEGVANSLKKISNNLNVEIEFTEVLPDEMPAVYDSISLLVLPSVYEGLSMVLLEAIASERPALSTPVGASPTLFAEVYKAEAPNMLFEIGGHEELAKKAVFILKNRARMEKTCSTARERLMASYSWDKVVDETIHVYKEALGNG